MRVRFQVFAVLLTLLLFCQVVRAQFTPAPAPYGQQQSSPLPQTSPAYGNGEQQPPDDFEAAADQSHGVARLSVILGNVNIRRGDTSELTAAVVNAPLQTGDRVQTAGNGAAEVQIDGANVVRLAEGSEIAIADLELHRIQVQVGAGSVLYRVLRSSDFNVEIDTPAVALRPAGPSAIRVTLSGDGVTRISLYTGAAEMLGPQGTQPLRAGTTVLVRMGASGPEYQETSSIAPDQFDNWSSSRDGDLLSSQSAQLIGPELGGADELDRNGNWVPSQYGQVWAPREVSQDWAPYSNGEWSWQNYYGWTWVDYSPWGWAPYHYGRWFRNGSYGWCWWPGPRGVHPVWRPALVGFFGSGQGLGWVALAPHESFQAWWGRRSWIGNQSGGLARYGTGSVRFQNAAFRGAALFASRDNFSGPNRRFTWASSEQLRGATRFDGQIPVTPNRSSYRFSERQAFASPRVSGAYTRPTASPAATNGWQRFGAPGSQRAYERGAFSSTASSESGWHQFGRPPSSTSEERRQSNNYRAYGNSGPPPSSPARSSGNSSAPWRAFGNASPGRSWSGSSNGNRNGVESSSQPSPPPSRYSQPARESYRNPSSGGNSNRSSRPEQSHSGGGNRSGGGGHSRR